MKIINDRYRIKKEITQTMNSILFQGEDFVHKRDGIILKMLNQNSKKVFPKEYFFQEYLVSSQLKHPLIRDVHRFSQIFSMDGMLTKSGEYFYEAEDVSFLLTQKTSVETKRLFNELVCGLSFIHRTGFFHGDIRMNNFLFDGRSVKYFDLSPFLDPVEGQQYDIEKLNEVLNIFSIPPVKDGEILTHPLFSSEIQEEILYRHLEKISFPSAYWALHLRNGESLLTDKSWIFFNYEGDRENAYLFARGLRPALEIKGYRVLNVTNIQPGAFLDLIREMLLYFNRFEYGKQIIAKYGEEYVKIAPDLDFTSSRALKNENAEKIKLTDFGVQFIKDLLAIHPLALIIDDAARIDEDSLAVLEKISSAFSSDQFRVLFSYGKTDKGTEFSRTETVPRLTRKETEAVLRYYFHLFPEEDDFIDRIHDTTSGEPLLLKAGLENILRKKNVSVLKNRYSAKQKWEEYFNFSEQYKDSFSQCSEKEREWLGLIALYDGFIPESVLKIIPEKLQDPLRVLEARHIITLSGGVSLKYAALKNAIPPVKPNPLYHDVLKSLSGCLEENISSVEPFARLMTIQKEYDEYLSYLFSLYEKMREEQRMLLHEGFYLSFLHLYRHLSDICEDFHFILIYSLAREDKKRELDYKEICRKLDELSSDKEEQYKALTISLIRDTISIEEAQRKYSVFDEYGEVPEKLWQRTTSALLEYLANKALFKEAISLFNTKVLPVIDTFHFETQFSLYSAVATSYLIMNDYRMMKFLGEKLLEIVRLHEAEIPLDFVFSANNIAGIGSHKDHQKALKHYEKNVQIAREMHNDNLFSVVNNNIAVVYYRMNRPDKQAEYLKKAIEAGTRGKAYSPLLTALNNLIVNYLQDYRFSEILSLIEEYEPIVQKLESLESIHNFYTLVSRTYYHLGDYKKMNDYFEKTVVFFDENIRTRGYFQYFVIKVIRALHRGDYDRAEELINGLEKESYFSENPGPLYNIFACLVFYLFYYPRMYPVIKKLSLKMFNEMSDYKVNTEPQYQYAVELFLAMTGDHPDPRSLVLADAHFFSAKALFLYVYLYTHPELSLQDLNFTALYLLMLEKVETRLGEEAFAVMEKTPFWKSHTGLLKERGFQPLTISAEEYVKTLAPRVKRENKSLLKKFYERAVYSHMVSVEGMAEECIKKTMAMYGVTRGIYYEFDPVKKWVKKKEIYDPMYYIPEEPIIESVLNKQLFLSEDILYFMEPRDIIESRGIAQAFSFPIIDIATVRSSIASESSSFSNVLSIKGCFYFDTKKMVTKPFQSELNRLFFMREYANATVYYNLLKEKTLMDPLTRLYKRSSWTSLTKGLLDRQRMSDGHLAFLMADIDYFKNVNDEYGHKEGDRILREVADVFLKSTRSVDIVGRYGGEEFVFALMIKNKEQAEMIAERIRSAVEKKTMMEEKTITVSLGLSLYPDDGSMLEELIEKADYALLHAKEGGRNQVSLWENVNAKGSRRNENNEIISNPSREGGKIRALLDLAQISSEIMSPEYIIDTADDIVSRCFNGSLFMGVKEKENLHFYPEREEYSQLNQLPSHISDTYVEIFRGTYGLKEAVIYYNTQNSSLDVHLDRRFAALMGRMIFEKVMLFYEEGRLLSDGKG